MSQTSKRSSNFFSTKNSQRQLDINILQIFIKDHPTRRDALVISFNRAAGRFGRSADTAVKFFPLSAGFSGGAFFTCGKIVFWQIFICESTVGFNLIILTSLAKKNHLKCKKSRFTPITKNPQ